MERFVCDRSDLRKIYSSCKRCIRCIVLAGTVCGPPHQRGHALSRQEKFYWYFLDNEPEWKAQRMFEFYLRLGKSKPGSQAFATYLKTYYQGKISTLNHEWGTSHASFEKIPGTRPPKRYSMHMQQGI